MNKPEEYHAIRVWGHSMGSYAYYWKEQQRLASEANAPINAIYFDDLHRIRWITTDDLNESHPFHETMRLDLERRSTLK